MKRFYLTALFLLTGTVAAQTLPVQQLTLEDAIQRALEVSDQVQISKEELRRSALKIDEAGALRYPKLDLLGQYLFTSKVMKQIQPPTTVSTPLGDFVIPGKEIAFGDQNAAEFQLKVTQPIFTGFALTKSHRAAQADAKVTEAEFRRTSLEVSYSAGETYVQAQKAEALVEITRLQIETLQRHQQDAARRVREGVVPQEVSARADYALQQAELLLQQSEHGVRLTKIALGELLKLPADSVDLDLDPLSEAMTDNGVGSAGLPVDAKSEDYLDYALQMRLELEKVRLQKSVVQEQIGIQKASFYPSLAAFGSVNYGRPGVDRIANEWMLYETAGVSLNWTLWDWNARKSRVEQVKVVQRQLDQTYSALESSVRIQVSSADIAVQDAKTKLEVAEKGLKLAKDIFAWVQQRYNQGTATESEYLDAQDEVNKSQLQIILAQADYLLAKVAIKRACGLGVVLMEEKP
ncbi:MAG: TolC family protein [bacterium]|nr:TolC family protein [bacterium]